MSNKTIEAIVASPPERDDLVVQLFSKDDGQWGEVFGEADTYILEMYERNGTKTRRIPIDELSGEVLGELSESMGWTLNMDEALQVVRLSRDELAAREL